MPGAPIDLRHTDPLAWLVACEEIRQLASRYANALDSRDLDALVELFVPDVRVGRDGAGREALRADFDRQLRAIGVSILHVANHVIDVADADHATGAVSCRGEIQEGDRWIVQSIQYRDRYERRDGRWLFVRRRHLLFYGAELGQVPLGLAPANWPASSTGAGELPDHFPTWQSFWGDAPPPH